LHNFNFF